MGDHPIEAPNFKKAADKGGLFWLNKVNLAYICNKIHHLHIYLCH